MGVATRLGAAGLDVRLGAGVAHLTLDRPEKRNALSRAMIARIEEELDAVERNTEVRVVVLGARGPVFCAGHDLSEMTGRSEEEYRDLFAACSRMMLKLRGLPQPVIARVQGVATAAGCQLVAACDLALASEDASFATPGVKIGLFCSTPMVPLVRAIPDKAAMEMLLTGAPISARRACELGLVNRVVPATELDAAIGELTQRIAAMSPLALRVGKQAFYALRDVDERTAYERAVEVMTANAMGHDAQEGISAFLQKRPAVWTGN